MASRASLSRVSPAFTLVTSLQRCEAWTTLSHPMAGHDNDAAAACCGLAKRPKRSAGSGFSAK